MKEIFFYLMFIEKKWKSKIGLLVEIVLIFLLLVKFRVNIFQWYSILILLTWITIWYIACGRYIFPSSKYIVIYCIKTDNETLNHYKKIFKKLSDKLDTFRLNEIVKIYDISSEIINNTRQAEIYRKKKNVDYIIWGNSFKETKNGKTLINFKLHFTFKINKLLQEKMDLFKKDLILILGTRDWIINSDNTLTEEEKIVNNFIEVSMFNIGIYLLTDYKLYDAIYFFNKLKLMISLMQEDTYKKYIIGRINSLILESNLLLGNIKHGKGNYEEAKKCYLEVDKFKIKNKFEIYIRLARIEYLLTGNIDKAKEYTDKAKKINKNHPVVHLNYAFFGILDKRYDSALYWYKKVLNSVKPIDVQIISLLEFLYNEYDKNREEFAFLFAIGALNVKFADSIKGISELSKFIKNAKNNLLYNEMIKYSKELIKKYKKK
jgi:tetratricopeptide (TPR) repeat protein